LLALTARSGNGGRRRALLEAAQRLQPDVIVLDLSLPNVDGLEACQIARAHPEIRVVMFTATDDPT
jgi:CheY-like chemotaxis protein